MNNTHKTAIARTKLSRPARFFKPFLFGKCLDFGCGRGTDADLLGMTKYDPHFFNEKPEKESFDCVMVNYVLNTTPYPEDVVKQAKEYIAGYGLLLIACRCQSEIARCAAKGKWTQHKDGKGWITQALTYQRGITTEELRVWVGWGDVIEVGVKEYSYIIVRKPNF